MLSATCGVFPSRAEGFNLELLEMMACGKPITATNYSAHTEYLTPQNALLIEGSRAEPANDGVSLKGVQGNWMAWGESQTAQLVQHMKVIYEQYRAGDKLLNTAGCDTASQLTWDATADKIIRHAYA